ncbi:hypothetical protein ANTRET_LOCUS12 [Anthophora retusa]
MSVLVLLLLRKKRCRLCWHPCRGSRASIRESLFMMAANWPCWFLGPSFRDASAISSHLAWTIDFNGRLIFVKAYIANIK